MYAEPSVLQVLSVPLAEHTLLPGTQVCALHTALCASQYCELVQVLLTEVVSPLVEHCFTSCPWQKEALGVQTCGLHAPVSQVVLAAQAVPPAT